MIASEILQAYGWNESIAHQFHNEYPANHIPARVIRVDRGLCEVVTHSGIARMGITRQLSVCTGDWVALLDGEVTAVLPRKTAIVRSSASQCSEPQVLAANVDVALVVESLTGDFDVARLERLLALAWESGARPLILLTKSDLVTDAELLVSDTEAIAPGVEVIAISAATGEGIARLRERIVGTAVLLGRSGVGKSTLSNVLLDTDELRVGATRESDGKGRHTTVTRELFPLPSGGTLIDTPGLRGIGIWDSPTGIEQVFSEIGALAEQCRFADCVHHTEPDCAVLAALQNGELHERRLASYRKLLRENEWVASRSDARLRAERNRKWRVIHKAQRAVYRKRETP